MSRPFVRVMHIIGGLSIVGGIVMVLRGPFPCAIAGLLIGIIGVVCRSLPLPSKRKV